MSVTKEQRLAEPVVKPTPPETTAVDQLTKAFEKLSVNLLQQQQQPYQQAYRQPYRRYPCYRQQPPVNPLTDAQKGPQNASGEGLPSVNVGAYAVGIRSGRTTGVCWYCLNQNPLYLDPPHRFREQCPWYRRHLAIGTAHVNENGRLARGSPRLGAPEFFIQPGRPEGTQVVLATAGTPEDENIENRPKDRTQPQPGAAVASITLLQGDGDEDEEEVPRAFQALAAQVERTRTEDRKWRNPTKIIKKTEPRERQLAVPKTIRTGEWKPATVTDVTDEGIKVDQEPTDEAVLIRVKDNPAKPKRQQRTPKKRYLDIIKETTNSETVFDEVIKQPVTIKL